MLDALMAQFDPARHHPVLFLRAGHHNQDPGAVANGHTEHSLTTRLRDALKAALLPLGVPVHTDTDSDNLATDVAKLHPLVRPQDLVLDVHFNAGPASASGTECFVAMHASQRAQSLAHELAVLTAQVLAIPNRHRYNAMRAKREWQTAHGRLAIMRLPTDVVLWEVAFLTNANDLAAYLQHEAELVRRVARFLAMRLQP
jgi:N-acetylmuramoyl-L-alanine amidase